MNVTRTILAVDVRELSTACGLPVRTLYRWAEKNRIAGRAAEQRLWFEKIKDAARKLPKRGPDSREAA